MSERGHDLPRRRAEPVRDLHDLMVEMAKQTAAVHQPRWDVGEVLVADVEGEDGIVVQLDGSSSLATDCLALDHVFVAEGDRVLTLFLRGEFFLLGVVNA